MTEERFDYAKYYTDIYMDDTDHQGADSDLASRRRRCETLMWMLSPKQGSKLLDIGAGKGELLELARLRGVDGCGIEVSTPRIELCVRKGLRVQEGDAYALPFKDEQFEYVVISEVLEHLQNPGKAVHEIHRVLKSGGTMAVTVPVEKLAYTTCMHCHKQTPCSAGHLQQFDEVKLRALVEPDFRVMSLRIDISVFRIDQTRKLPFLLWYFFQRLCPKRYPKYVVLAQKQ